MVDQKNAQELLQCPFCGCDTMAIYEDAVESVGRIAENGGFYISHPLWKEYPETWNCRCEILGYFDSKKSAVEAWNTRAALPSDAIRQARNDALREAASAGSITCYKTRHVTLGDAVKDAILSMIDKET